MEGSTMAETQPYFPEGARVICNGEGPRSFRGRTGTVTAYYGGSGYEVSFDNGQVEYANAHWLDSEPPKA
jgi:hypothetical protein